MKKLGLFIGCIFVLLGCATGRDITSKHYLPEWENKIVNLPNPSETTGGYWAMKTAQTVSKGTQKVVLFPFAIAGNAAVNAYYIPTWPLRWLARGDRRLIVWYPLFDVGQNTGSDFFTKQWNQDLI
jgi:hypothetical protein